MPKTAGAVDEPGVVTEVAKAIQEVGKKFFKRSHHKGKNKKKTEEEIHSEASELARQKYF